MFFVFVLLFVFLRFVFVSPSLQNEIETKTAHGIAKTLFRSSPGRGPQQPRGSKTSILEVEPPLGKKASRMKENNFQNGGRTSVLEVFDPLGLS